MTKHGRSFEDPPTDMVGGSHPSLVVDVSVLPPTTDVLLVGCGGLEGVGEEGRAFEVLIASFVRQRLGTRAFDWI